MADEPPISTRWRVRKVDGCWLAEGPDRLPPRFGRIVYPFDTAANAWRWVDYVLRNPVTW